MDFQEIIPERYRVNYANGVFRILDTWHESIKNLSGLDVDIPDNSPAMAILSTEQVSALMTKLNELGWLQKYATSTDKKAPQAPAPNIAVNNASPLIDIRLNAIDRITEVVTTIDVDNTLAKEAISAIKSITEGR